MHIPRSSGINYYEADGPKNGYEPMIKEQFLMVAFAGRWASRLRHRIWRALIDH